MNNIGLHDLEIVGLTKAFGSITVLQGINTIIRSGEFVGLMGPNGAGKSTLIKILAGLYDASDGAIRLGGQEVRSLADHPAVGFIHQDLGLVDWLTIAENLSLGGAPRRLFGPILNSRVEREDAERALRLVGLQRPVDTLVKDLTAGEKTLVAVARVFDRGARILVVDETTSTLPPADANRVIQSLTEAAKNGATVIMVTHKLSEILDSTSRVLVLIDGELVRDAPTQGLDRPALVQMLTQQETFESEEVRGSVEESLAREQEREAILELRDVQVGQLGAVNLKLLAGEIIGISGLPGSGLHDVAFAVSGHLKPNSGEVALSHPGIRRALVPPHRESQGGFDDLSVRDNMAITALSRWRRFGAIISPQPERRDCADVAEMLSLKPRSVDTPFGILSGGNKQKVIFGRALLREPDVYVLCEPTRGVDVQTRAEIYRLIRQVADAGAAVLVASSDAEDLFSVCDRVALISDDQMQPLRRISELTTAEMEMMV